MLKTGFITQDNPGCVSTEREREDTCIMEEIDHSRQPSKV